MSAEELSVPEMIGFGMLSKIVVASLKVGADEAEKSYVDIATMAKVSVNNISLNSKFLTSIGINEGTRGHMKLTALGKQYAQSLDWGKLDEANKTLREILRDKPLAKKITGYVEMHQPVDRDELVGQIALFSGVPKEPRFETGIRGFVDMLVTCGLLEEESDAKIVAGKMRGEKSELEEPVKSESIDRRWGQSMLPAVTLQEEGQLTFPVTINLDISNDVDIAKLKAILETIKDVFRKS